MPELKLLIGTRHRPQLLDLLARAEEQRLARADRRAHRLLARRTCGRSTCRTSSSGACRRASSARRTGRPARSCCRRCSAACARVCTTPSPVRLIASAGQTSAQVGDRSACRRPAPSASTRARSTYSRWIIDLPLCVSHSRAGLHARLAADAAAGVDEELDDARERAWLGRSLLLRLQLLRRTPAAPSALLHAHRADLVLGDLRDRVLGGDRQLVGALRPGPVVGNEDRVGRIVVTTCACSVQLPRRDSAVAQSPSVMPSFSARRGCISMRGSGY